MAAAAMVAAKVAARVMVARAVAVVAVGEAW